MRARLAAGESAAHELSSLKEERDLIRTRVGEMLEQLEALNCRSSVSMSVPCAAVS